MSVRRFPSGPWTGFFTYRADAGQHRMDLRLSFSQGRITGDGADSVGLFIIAGHFDETSGDCAWTKTYVGAHDVFYTGFRSGRGISGVWTIPGHWSGGFNIWPVDGEVTELAVEEEETETNPFEPSLPVGNRGAGVFAREKF
jgi:hypothetical protein